MNVKLISCWFRTSYGSYGDNLRKALERRVGREVGVIATNCGCGDPIEVGRKFQDKNCDYFWAPTVGGWKSRNPAKDLARRMARQAAYWVKARGFHAREHDADVVHFQQILNSLGSLSLFHWLKMPCSAARVVTVHELDEYQREFPSLNLTYNLADRIIVHCQEMKQSLAKLAVREDLIDIVEHGTVIEPLTDGPRSGIIYYGGHHFTTNKGFDTLTKALALLKPRFGPDALALRVHGHYGDTPSDYAVQLVRENGLEGQVTWLNQISFDAAAAEYRKALMCVLPYTGSFAGYPAATAMANGAPVIATRRAGLPDHLGDAAIYVGENDVEGLVAGIEKLLTDAELRNKLAREAHERASRFLSWDAISDKTLKAYQAALEHKAAGRLPRRAREPERAAAGTG